MAVLALNVEIIFLMLSPIRKMALLGAGTVGSKLL
jgi:hypothetical protein